MDNMQMKMNGLHSGTVLREKNIGNGIREQWHEHPETGEIVVVHTWYVSDSDCVSSEAEVKSVYEKREGLASCILALEAIDRSVNRYCNNVKELIHG